MSEDKSEEKPLAEKGPGVAVQDGRRRSKFLCVVDATPECNVAVYYAARRAKHVGGAVSLLYVIEPADFQHWASVKDVMAQEARDEAEQILKDFSDRVQDVSDHPAELVIREGKLREEILAHLEDDDKIAILVLGAASGKNGPGPLVSSLAGRDTASQFPIPVIVVPGTLSADDIKALS
jgi:nucleotide-binding universal stress UspA family protein